MKIVGKIPATLLKECNKHKDRIELVEVEYDRSVEIKDQKSYWIYLSDGWRNEWQENQMIHEWTVKECVAQLKKAIAPCSCDECTYTED